MVFSVRATTAMDLIIQVVIRFQEELPLIDSALSAIVDGITELRRGEISEESMRNLELTSNRMQNLEKAIKGLSVIDAAIDLILDELQPSEG